MQSVPKWDVSKQMWTQPRYCNSEVQHMKNIIKADYTCHKSPVGGLMMGLMPHPRARGRGCFPSTHHFIAEVHPVHPATRGHFQQFTNHHKQVGGALSHDLKNVLSQVEVLNRSPRWSICRCERRMREPQAYLSMWWGVCKDSCVYIPWVYEGAEWPLWRTGQQHGMWVNGVSDAFPNNRK